MTPILSFTTHRRALMVSLTLALLSVMCATPALAALSTKEEARINAMLALLEKRSDLAFIRNGSSHNAVDAVAHLKLKLSRTRNRIDTAEQFIDKVASSSSVTGESYMIQQAGQKPEPAKPFLHKLLEQVNQ